MIQGVLTQETMIAILPPIAPSQDAHKGSSSGTRLRIGLKVKLLGPPILVHWPLPLLSTPSPVSALSTLPASSAPTG